MERAFRTLKGLDLQIRPIHHRNETRVWAHPFLCLLAYYLEWQDGLLSGQAIANAIYVESPFVHSSVMLRRDVVESAGGYREGDFPEEPVRRKTLWILATNSRGSKGCAR